MCEFAPCMDFAGGTNAQRQTAANTFQLNPNQKDLPITSETCFLLKQLDPSRICCPPWPHVAALLLLQRMAPPRQVVKVREPGPWRSFSRSRGLRTAGQSPHHPLKKSAPPVAQNMCANCFSSAQIPEAALHIVTQMPLVIVLHKKEPPFAQVRSRLPPNSPMPLLPVLSRKKCTSA